jgi:ATP-binding cassette, subfamily B, multidrug efflux pump
LIRGRTSIIIAHRLSTLKHVDKILVLKEGEIVEYGSQKDLLKLKGVYHKLYNLQADVIETSKAKLPKNN